MNQDHGDVAVLLHEPRKMFGEDDMTNGRSQCFGTNG